MGLLNRRFPRARRRKSWAGAERAARRRGAGRGGGEPRGARPPPPPAPPPGGRGEPSPAKVSAAMTRAAKTPRLALGREGGPLAGRGGLGGEPGEEFRGGAPGPPPGVGAGVEGI